MSARSRVKTGAEWCAALLLVAAVLPALGVVAFMLRFAVIGILALALAAAATGYCLCPPFRKRTHDAVRSATSSN